MGNQFFYTIKFKVPGATPEAEPTERDFMASFNVDMVIRSLETADGGLVVILDDFHEEMVTMPNTINPNTNKVIHGKKELQTLQSEITLSKEDKERFYKLLNVEESWMISK